NQGGRTVYMKRFVDEYKAEVLDKGLMTFRTSDCSASEVFLPPEFCGAVVMLVNDPLALRTSSSLGVGYLAAVRRTFAWWEGSDITVYPIMSTKTGARGALLKEMKEKRVHGVSGVVTEELLKISRTIFFDPVFLVPRINNFQRHVIQLSPTLEQEFFVVAQYLGNTTVANAHAVIR
ncbi:putative receptor-type adenylate cyclase, partial [Trypanosoma grayi]|uniref:putative receptor-type adenylate cyclase n=1 Tax=Trypanosoma grayi TaxID=71804 RepID=UPI0004F45227